MSNHWWRAYDEAVDDPKLQMLTDRLFRAWFNICCITSQNGDVIPSIDTVAFKLRTTPARAAKIIGELRAANLIDEADGSMAPHNWSGRQFKSDVTDPTNATRQKRYRDRHRITENTVTITRPREQITYTEKKDAADAAPIDPDADLFRRGKEVLGTDSGSLIARLKKTKSGSIPHARAAIEQASTKENPREYIGRIIQGAGRPTTTINGNPWPEGIT